jgi:TonB family protein
MGKINQFVLLLLLAFSSAAAQDTIHIYLNSKWKEVKTRDEATYLRKQHHDGTVWHVTDYYKDGTVQMTGTFADKKATRYLTGFKFYYPNGKIQMQGSYHKNSRQGHWIYYFDNGLLDREGDFVNGRMHGKWKWYDKDRVCSIETYAKDSRESAQFFDADGREVAEKYAEYPAYFEFGKPNAFSDWLLTQIVYPPEAMKKDVSGKIKIRFVVNETGDIEDIEIKKEANPMLEAEAVRAIGTSPKWTPGKQHNRPVKYEFRLPVNFRT